MMLVPGAFLLILHQPSWCYENERREPPRSVGSSTSEVSNLTEQGVGKRGLAASDAPHHGHHRPRLGFEVYVLQLKSILERHQAQASPSHTSAHNMQYCYSGMMCPRAPTRLQRRIESDERLVRLSTFHLTQSLAKGKSCVRLLFQLENKNMFWKLRVTQDEPLQ